MKPVRVGIIGLGWGELLIESFRRVHGVEVRALCDADANRLGKTAQRHKVDNTFSDYRDLVKSPEVDWVCVAAPPTSHAAMIRQTIEAGKHVLTEKPVAMQTPEIRELLEAAKAKGIIHGVDYEMRFLPAQSYAKELIDEDYLGPLHRVEAKFIMEHPWGEHGNWVADEDAGGGVMMELGAHFIDTLLWWFGPVKNVLGGCRTNFPTVRIPAAKEGSNGKSTTRVVTGDDAFWCLLQFERGGEALVNFFTGARHDPGWTIEAYGQTGSLVVKSGNLMGMRQGDREMALLPIPKRLELGDNPRDPLMWAMSRLIDRALAKIDNNSDDKSFPTFQDGLAVARTIEAIRQASRERCWISLDGG